MGSNDISPETSVLNKKTDDILREMKKHLSNDEYVLAKKAYDIFNEKVGEYLLSVLNHVEALQDNTRAITTKKIDPYIAGGAMNGIARPVAGVATAKGVKAYAVDEEDLPTKDKCGKYTDADGKTHTFYFMAEESS